MVELGVIHLKKSQNGYHKKGIEMTVRKGYVVYWKKMYDDVVIPSYETEGAVGMDIQSYVDYDLHPKEQYVVKTGLKLQMPSAMDEYKMELQIRPRSGLAAKFGITVVNTPGTIDPDYRGEIMVILKNTGTSLFKIKKGDRIAQGVFNLVPRIICKEAEELSDTERGEGGLGSTGK